MKPDRPYAVSTKLLLWVHAIIPVLFLVWLIDVSLLAHTLQPYLQITAMTFAWYLLLFELPHIIASFISYADGEYIRHYRKLLVGAAVIVLAVLSLFWFNQVLAILLYVVATMYHVLRQQTGITGMLLRRFSRMHSLWSWSAIVAYSYGFVLVMYAQYGFVSLSWFYGLSGVFLLITLLYASSLRGAPKAGQWYFWTTSATAAMGIFFITVGYPFLAIFVIRFVHDVTAFIFYAVHDSNRNYAVTKNMLYRLLRPLKLPLLITTPIVALVATYGLRVGLDPLTYTGMFILSVGFAHYFLESFMWKRDSLHRQHIQIAD